MKNLFKSVSACGNPAKFVWKGEIMNYDVENSTENNDSKDDFNLEDYTQKRKSDMNSISSNSELFNKHPIFKDFMFDADMFSEAETVAVLKKHGFKFEGRYISVAGATKRIELDDNTKGILVVAQTDNIVKIVILNKTGADNVDIFNFETGEVSFDGVTSDMKIPKVKSNNEYNHNGLKIELSQLIKIEGGYSWLNEASVDFKYRQVFEKAFNQGYSLLPSASKEGGVVLLQDGKVVDRIDDLQNNTVDWLHWVLKALKKRGIE